MRPSMGPSKQPTFLPSVSPSISSAPSNFRVTPVPTAVLPIDRTATISVEIGVDGLSSLNAICVGFEGFISQGIQDEYGLGATTQVVCTRGQGRRSLQDNTTTSVLDEDEKPDMVTNQLDYEKPVLITLSTTFPDYKRAPRQFGFLDFLEQLVVSDRAIAELPQYVQQALGPNADIGGVHVTLVQARKKAVLIVAFGEDSPTASPTVLNVTADNSTLAPISLSTANAVPCLVSLLLCALVGGIMVM